MTLKAIKEGLRVIAHDDMDAGKCTKCRIQAEIEALEEAAKNLVEIWGYAGDGNPAETLIRAIAKEAEL